MDGLIKEGEGIIEETEIGAVRDAGIIGACQKVEHYEIATYGTLRTWSRALGEAEITTILEETLAEEKEADVTLTIVAESAVNADALEADEEEENEEEETNSSSKKSSKGSSKSAAPKKSGKSGSSKSKK